MINRDHPMTIQKAWGHHFPCWINPLTFHRREWARVLPLFALQFWLWVKVVNTCLILGYNSFNKIAGIILIVRQEIPRNIELSPHWSTFATPILPKPSTYLECQLELIILSQNSSYHTQLGFARPWHFHQCSTFGAARLSIILNALSLPRKHSCLLFHWTIRRRLLPKGFHEVFINFLGRHSFLIEICTWWPLWFHVSPFCKFYAPSSLKSVLH